MSCSQERSELVFRSVCTSKDRRSIASLFSTGRHHRVLLPTACSSYSMIRAQQITHLPLKQNISREKRNTYYLQTPTALFKALSSVKRICRNVQRRAAVSYGHFVGECKRSNCIKILIRTRRSDWICTRCSRKHVSSTSTLVWHVHYGTWHRIISHQTHSVGSSQVAYHAVQKVPKDEGGTLYDLGTVLEIIDPSHPR